MSLGTFHRYTALGLLAGFLAMAQTAAPPANWRDPDQSEPASTHYRTFTSRLAGGEVSYLIYLPPDYQSPSATNRRYPVVYWLHGLGGDQRRGTAFVAQLDSAIRERAVPPVIAVLVNGMRDSLYCDSRDGKWPVESVIVKELIPHIDQTYRTVADRKARIVEGFSMGGYGAAHLGFKYPEVFGVVGIMAGALVDFGGGTARNAAVFAKMFGSDKAYTEVNEPRTLVRKNADAIRGKTVVRIAVGDRDGLQTRNQAFHELLNELKIEHEYEVVPGVGHNNPRFYQLLGARAFAYYSKPVK